MIINNLSKSFGDKIIFDNLSLEINDGQITYIMGESGCGKTTLLRILAGLDTSYEGNITPLNNVTYVFQEPRLFPTLNIKKNIEIVNDNPQVSLQKVLEIVELSGEELSLPNTLSGGMKMRASLARALYHNKDVFLMDEPFSALDEDMKNRIIPKIFEYLKGKTIIIVSHDLNEAQKYSNNIINLKKPQG